MNVICTFLVPSTLSAHFCTSATKLPSVDSPPRFSANVAAEVARRKSAEASPITTLPSSFATSTASSTIGFTAGSSA